MGDSGCGKTSLLKVLAGLAPPATGTITWQGQTITSANVNSWRQCCSYLPQRAECSNDSIINNILWPWQRLTLPSPSLSRIEQALRPLRLATLDLR
ncbi:ATP-binding cassette domain-containing protein [Shewanella sp. NIFS-20-20]|nr:ATP-binding cassette domain-containing protein [Shewanella sp. NIFS-20-20]